MRAEGNGTARALKKNDRRLNQNADLRAQETVWRNGRFIKTHANGLHLNLELLQVGMCIPGVLVQCSKGGDKSKVCIVLSCAMLNWHLPKAQDRVGLL